MTSKTKAEIKAFFNTGDKPTESQFIDLIDSYVDREGPIGDIETAASAGTTGIPTFSGGVGQINSYNAIRSQLGVTVYTTALSSAVASGVIEGAYASTAAAIAGASAQGIMNPVLVKNAINSLSGASGMVLIGTSEASNTASLTITGLDSTYDTYFIAISDMVPATDNAVLYLRLGDSGGIDSGASDYGWHVQNCDFGAATYSGANDASDSEIELGEAGVGTDAGEGIGAALFLHKPSDGTTDPMITGTYMYRDNASNRKGGSVIGSRLSAIAVDRVQVSFSTGNIESGRLTVWGLKHG